jgi:hypothetical protein
LFQTKSKAGLFRDAMNALTDQTRSSDFQVVTPVLQLPVMRGMIDRRMLVNFRCDPLALARIVPDPFHVKLVDNRTSFPPGSVEFDSAFLMRGIEHEWHARGRMLCNHKLCDV